MSFRGRPKAGTRNPETSTAIVSGFRVHSLRSRPGMTNRRTSSPVFFAAPGTPSSLLRPSNKSRGWRARRRVMQSEHVLLPARGASRRAIAAFSLQRRAALSGSVSPCLAARSSRRLSGQPLLPNLGQPQRPAVSQLLAGVPSDPGRSPGAARVQEERFISCPRAPHPIPPARRLMTAPSVDRIVHAYIPIGLKSRGQKSKRHPYSTNFPRLRSLAYLTSARKR